MNCTKLWSKMEMTRMWFCHPSFTNRLIVINPLDIPISRISDHIEDNENDKYHDVDNRYFSPALLQAPKNTGFTRATLITEHALVVAPQHTVRVRSCDPSSRVPPRLIHIWKTTICWWLATAGLQSNDKYRSFFVYKSS